MARARWIQDEHGVRKTPEAYLADALQSIIDRHDKMADEDNPPMLEEDGHMSCGCKDCQIAKDALRAVGRE